MCLGEPANERASRGVGNSLAGFRLAQKEAPGWGASRERVKLEAEAGSQRDDTRGKSAGNSAEV